MIFQELMTSFSALHTIGNQISSVAHHEPMSLGTACASEDMLSLVIFSKPGRVFDMYPSTFGDAARDDRDGADLQPATADRG